MALNPILKSMIMLAAMKLRKMPPLLPKRTFLALPLEEQRALLDYRAAALWQERSDWRKVSAARTAIDRRRARQRLWTRWQRIQRLCGLIEYKPRIRVSPKTGAI